MKKRCLKLVFALLMGAVLAGGGIASAAENTPAVTNGKPVTEENVLEMLHQIEKDWPQDTIWGTSKTPGTHKNDVSSTEAQRIMDTYPVRS